MTSKDTNPKDAVGTAKVPFSTVPAAVIGEIGLAMMEGARKYGRHNYRVAGIRASVYYDAALRHLTAWWEGQEIDPDSGLSHVTKALACLTVLRDAMMNEKVTDDRPPRMRDNAWVTAQNAKAAELIERYPAPVPPYTEVDLRPGAIIRVPAQPIQEQIDAAFEEEEGVDPPGSPYRCGRCFQVEGVLHTPGCPMIGVVTDPLRNAAAALTTVEPDPMPVHSGGYHTEMKPRRTGDSERARRITDAELCLGIHKEAA